MGTGIPNWKIKAKKINKSNKRMGMRMLIILSVLLISLLGNHAQYEDCPLAPIKLFLNRSEVPMLENGHRRLSSVSTTAPLFRGLGTHYSFLWVGTPAQRVSVIMDTGSHHTAFPCVGCKCGKHMDPHFDPQKSSTSKTKACGAKNDKCFFRQSYSEGSSWHAFKVTDKVYIGGEKFQDLAVRNNQSIDFEFGCQDSETGLFRTQNVDGIMGLSASDETLPFQLFKNKITTTKLFALCFRVGGGILTLGGIDPKLHQYKEKRPVSSLATSSSSFLFSAAALSSSAVAPVYSKSTISYAKLIKQKGWFTVTVIDISMINPKDGTTSSIGGSIAKCNAGKGTIVDSGTTDTYFPHAISGQFTGLFKKITGSRYRTEAFTLTLDQLKAIMPIIVMKLEGVTPNEPIEIPIYPESYFEKIGNNKYVPRIYLSESTGSVLGANFMNDQNVIFDIENRRVGFAKSDCLEEFMK